MLADYQWFSYKVWEHNRLKVKDWKTEKYYEIGPQFDIAIVKVLQLLGDFVPQTPYRGSAPGPRWGTTVPQTPCNLPYHFPNCAGAYGTYTCEKITFMPIVITVMLCNSFKHRKLWQCTAIFTVSFTVSVHCEFLDNALQSAMAFIDCTVNEPLREFAQLSDDHVLKLLDWSEYSRWRYTVCWRALQTA